MCSYFAMDLLEAEVYCQWEGLCWISWIHTERRELCSVHQLCPPTPSDGQIPVQSCEEEEWLSQSCRTHKTKPGRKEGKRRIGRGSMARSLLGSRSYSQTEIEKILWRIPNCSTSYEKHESTDDTTPCYFLLEFGVRVTESTRYQSQNWGNRMLSLPTLWLTSVKATPKVMPPTLLCWLTTSKVDVGGMAVGQMIFLSCGVVLPWSLQAGVNRHWHKRLKDRGPLSWCPPSTYSCPWPCKTQQSCHSAVTPVSVPPKATGAQVTGVSNQAGGIAPFQGCFYLQQQQILFFDAWLNNIMLNQAPPLS